MVYCIIYRESVSSSRVLSRVSLCVSPCMSLGIRPVTGDIVPHLNCSGGDYLSHHNNYILLEG